MSQQIGAAVVGLGANGMGTVATALDAEHVHHVVGVDLEPAQCRDAHSRFGIRTTPCLEDVLDDPDIRLIYISTSNAAHHPIGVQALEAGKKVCMEKPMGISPDETEDLVRLAAKPGAFLQVGFECRNYSKLYVRVKDILDSGEIGELRHVNCQYVLSPWGTDSDRERWKYTADASGGLFAEKLCHYVDLPRWWDGSRVCRFFATKAANVIPYYGIADNVEVTYAFESGTVSHLTFLYGAAGKAAGADEHAEELERQRGEGYRLYYQVVGTEGAVEANVFSRELRVFHHPGKVGQTKSTMVRVESWEPGQDHLWFHNTADEKRDVARRVALGLPPAIDPEDAAETMRLCFAFEEAAARPWMIVER